MITRYRVVLVTNLFFVIRCGGVVIQIRRSRRTRSLQQRWIVITIADEIARASAKTLRRGEERAFMRAKQ